MLTTLGDVQIPLLVAMLLGGCLAKLVRVIQVRSFDAGLGPTALFPLRLRRPAAVALCAVEFGLGVGLILTSGQLGKDGPAQLVRLGTGLLFLVATCSLIELRSVRPDIGCGCFGEFSASPITGRTLLRSALLAIAALGTIYTPPIHLPQTAGQAGLLLSLLIAELALFGWLSPEVRDLLVKIGYSAPCELRVLSTDQTLSVLQHSAQWRKHSSLITGQHPSDMWRELCWSYITFPSRYAERDAEIVFAVYLQNRRPAVLSALVDAATGAVLPWPVGSARPAGLLRPRLMHRGAPVAVPILPDIPPWPTRPSGSLSPHWAFLVSLA